MKPRTVVFAAALPLIVACGKRNADAECAVSETNTTSAVVDEAQKQAAPAAGSDEPGPGGTMCSASTKVERSSGPGSDLNDMGMHHPPVSGSEPNHSGGLSPLVPIAFQEEPPAPAQPAPTQRAVTTGHERGGTLTQGVAPSGAKGTRGDKRAAQGNAAPKDTTRQP